MGGGREGERWALAVRGREWGWGCRWCAGGGGAGAESRPATFNDVLPLTDRKPRRRFAI